MNIQSIIPLIILVQFILIPSVNLAITPSLIIDIDNGNNTYMVFIDILYPQGFKNVYKAVVRGHSTIYLDVSDVKKAWDRELSLRGRYSKLVVRIVAYDEKGLVGVKIESIDFNRMLLDNTVRVSFAKTQSLSKPSLSTLSGPPITSVVSAIRVLEDSCEWNATILLAMLRLDSTSFGELRYSYSRGLEIGFTIYLVVPEIQLAGWIPYSRSVGTIKDVFLKSGESGYVWMTFRYRWERWRVYGPGLPLDGYIEEYVYITNFYPETAGAGYNKPSNAIYTHTDGWNSQLYEASSSGYPYFYVNYGDINNRYTSIDLVSFANMLLALSKITSSTRNSIATLIPVIGVDSYIDNHKSYEIHVDVYSNQVPTRHIVNISKANVYIARFYSFPVVYVTTQESG